MPEKEVPVFEGKISSAKVLYSLLKSIHFKEEANCFIGDHGMKVTVEEAKSYQANAFIQKNIFHEFSLRDEVSGGGGGGESDGGDASDARPHDVHFKIHLTSLLECLNALSFSTGSSSCSGFGGGGGATRAAAAAAAAGGGGAAPANSSSGGGGRVSWQQQQNSHSNVGWSSRGSASLRLAYDGYGHPLRLCLEENGVICDAQIKTQEPEDTVDFNFSRATVAVKLIMVSADLKEIFSELEASAASHIEVRACPVDQSVRLTTHGAACGQFSVEIPADSDMISHFQVQQLSVAKYKLSSLKHGLKPVGATEKVSVRIDSAHVLCLQYMVKIDSGGTSFLEFYCSPEVDDD